MICCRTSPHPGGSAGDDDEGGEGEGSVSSLPAAGLLREEAPPFVSFAAPFWEEDAADGALDFPPPPEAKASTAARDLS